MSRLEKEAPGARVSSVVAGAPEEGEASVGERWSPPWTRPTILAPLEGVSHATFRGLMAARGGLGMVCTEFVRISRAPLSVRAVQREVIPAPGLPLCVQVMGNEPAKMAEAASAVMRAGAAVVDLNLGCPAPRVVRHGVGSAMLRDPVLLHEVVSTMRGAVQGPLSVKMRAGYDDSGEVLRNAAILVDAGVDWITVHPRRRVDFYQGVADWRIIRRLQQALPVPVVGNGDCWYAADALRMMSETGCAAVMIGRPALRNPWIFRQIDALLSGRVPEDPDGDAVVSHLEEVVRIYRGAWPSHPEAPLGKLKELVGWLGRAVADGGALRRASLRAGSLDEIVGLWRAGLGGVGAEALDLDAWGRHGLEVSGSCKDL